MLTTMEETNYNVVAEDYKSIIEGNAVRVNITDYTMLQLVGDIEEKSVLDVGCGSGRFTRKLLQKGDAKKIVGIDYSESQIKLAIQEENKRDNGADRIQYFVEDMLKGDKPHKEEGYDIVIMMYVLCHMSTYEDLVKVCKYIYKKLKNGGRFIGVNMNMNFDMKHADKLWKYGFYEHRKEGMCDGDLMEVVIKSPVGGAEIALATHYFSPLTYARAFREAGLTLKYERLQLNPSVPNRSFYADYMKYEHAVILTATKIVEPILKPTQSM